MRLRFVALACIVACLAGVSPACKRSSPDASSAPEPETLAKVHWLGKKRVAAQKDAAYLMGIWGMPQAGLVEAEMLDKLSLAPWSISEGWKTNNLRATNAITALLRSVAADALEQESYTEIRQALVPSNAAPEIVMAFRLGEEQAQRWETNLSNFLLSAADAKVERSLSGGWTVPWPKQLRPLITNATEVAGTNAAPGSNAPTSQAAGSIASPARTLAFTRVGPWSLVGLGGVTNTLLEDFRARIRKDNIPFPEPKTNYWLSVDLEVGKMNRAFGLGIPLPANFPRIQLNWFGEGEHVLTRGRFMFNKGLQLPLVPWKVPTNLVREPLVSFTALRGYGSWLTNLTWTRDLGINFFSNQTFAWAQKASPVHFYSATPFQGASNQLVNWSSTLTNLVDPVIAEYARGALQYNAASNGFTWMPMPYVTPTLEAMSDSGHEYMIVRLASPLRQGTNAVPTDIFGRLVSTNNSQVFYYDWEMTQDRLLQWVFLAQSARIIFWFAQVPRNEPILDFLVAGAPRMGNSVTEMALAGTNAWTFARRSSTGFTGFEWQLLADWLASPQFPKSLNILVSNKLPKPKVDTNSPPKNIVIQVK